MKISRRMKTNIAKPYVEAAVEIIMQMNSGSAVTYARGGTMGSV